MKRSPSPLPDDATAECPELLRRSVTLGSKGHVAMREAMLKVELDFAVTLTQLCLYSALSLDMEL